MDRDKQRIADMLAGMQFGRKAPPSRQDKAAYAALEAGVADVLKDLKKLHLRLWHAISRREYHSLSLNEVRLELQSIQARISSLTQEE
ncbi:MAG: hypothetical protein GXW96_01175 [Christensenellaceae bacterium]|nr:hypothetical protein [Christensenellaceae bacterium]